MSLPLFFATNRTAQGQILSGSVDGTLKVWQPTLTPAENHLSDPINGTDVSLSPQRSFPGHHLGVVSVRGRPR